MNPQASSNYESTEGGIIEGTRELFAEVPYIEARGCCRSRRWLAAADVAAAATAAWAWRQSAACLVELAHAGIPRFKRFRALRWFLLARSSVLFGMMSWWAAAHALYR